MTDISHLPHETPESAARRKIVARDWLTSEAVKALLGSEASDEAITRLRREGHLFGVWIKPENQYLFPPWQFSDGSLIAQMKPLLSILRGSKGVAAGQPTSGWEELEWLLSPNPHLEGLTPAQSLGNEPQTVVDVAEWQFGEDPNERW